MSKAKLLINLRNSNRLLAQCNKAPALQAKCSTYCPPKDKETHTGQKWDDDDYRLARFVDRPKHVNKNWGIELISQVPPKKVHERIVWCDGGDPATGHPKVYINLDKPGDHTCGYCGLRFEKEECH